MMDEQRVLTAARAVNEISQKIDAMAERVDAENVPDLELQHMMADIRDLQAKAVVAAEELMAAAFGKTVEELRG